MDKNQELNCYRNLITLIKLKQEAKLKSGKNLRVLQQDIDFLFYSSSQVKPFFKNFFVLRTVVWRSLAFLSGKPVGHTFEEALFPGGSPRLGGKFRCQRRNTAAGRTPRVRHDERLPPLHCLRYFRVGQDVSGIIDDETRTVGEALPQLLVFILRAAGVDGVDPNDAGSTCLEDLRPLLLYQPEKASLLGWDRLGPTGKAYQREHRQEKSPPPTVANCHMSPLPFPLPDVFPDAC